MKPENRRMQEAVYSVSALTRSVRDLLEHTYPEVWVQGEISNLATPASGHAYFSLKDEHSQVRCAFFRNQRLRLAKPLEEGSAVLLRGKVSLYLGRGDFQVIVDYLEPAGEGELRRRYEQLKTQLERRGLFDSMAKRPLPGIPSRIAVITSASGAAVHDVLTTLKRRFRAAEVILHPVTVQGDTAVQEIVQAFKRISEVTPCDCVILARGGGSLEDLWAFNEEPVVHAIRECPVPVVTGIGHETDVTLADFAADLRAATPTAAAEAVSPDMLELCTQVERLNQRALQTMHRNLQDRGQRLDASANRLQHPVNRLNAQRHQLLTQQARLCSSFKNISHLAEMSLAKRTQRLQLSSPWSMLTASQLIHHELFRRLIKAGTTLTGTPRQQVNSAESSLEILNPRSTLGRGYAIVRRQLDGSVLTDAAKVKPGEQIVTELNQGFINSTVTDTGNKHKSPDPKH